MSTEILRQIAPDSKLAPSPASSFAGGGRGLHGVQPATCTHQGGDVTAAGGLGRVAGNYSALNASSESSANRARIEAYKRHDELRLVLRSARTKHGDWLFERSEHGSVKLPRVAQCRTRLIPGQEGALMRQGDRAHFSGLITCGNGSCPMCGPNKANAETLVLHWLWASAHKAGYGAIGLTLTAAHHAGMSLADFHNKLLRAMNKLRTHRRFRAIAERYGFLPMIRRSEVLFGRNGWHSHIHALIFGKFDGSAEELLALSLIIDSLWETALASVGLSGLSGIRAQVIRVRDADAAQYIAKFGKEPSEREWDAADETIRSHSKSSSGLSIMELLDISRAARSGSEAQPAGGSARWIPSVELSRAAVAEYYAFMRKRRLIDGMSRLAEALGLSIEEVRAEVKAELARQREVEAQQAELVMFIDAPTMGALVRTRTRGSALAIAGNGGSEADIWAMLRAAQPAGALAALPGQLPAALPGQSPAAAQPHPESQP